MAGIAGEWRGWRGMGCHSVGFVLIGAADFSVKFAQAPRPYRQALVETIWRGSDRVANGLPSFASAILSIGPGRRRDFHSAAPPPTVGRCFNRDGERASAERESRRRLIGPLFLMMATTARWLGSQSCVAPPISASKIFVPSVSSSITTSCCATTVRSSVSLPAWSGTQIWDTSWRLATAAGVPNWSPGPRTPARHDPPDQALEIVLVHPVHLLPPPATPRRVQFSLKSHNPLLDSGCPRVQHRSSRILRLRITWRPCGSAQ